MTSTFVPEEHATVGAEDDGTSAPVEPCDSPPSSAYARVAALLHESRRQAPDQVGSFLAGRVADFGMGDLSVYVTDFEQRRLVPIVGSAATTSKTAKSSVSPLPPAAAEPQAGRSVAPAMNQHWPVGLEPACWSDRACYVGATGKRRKANE